MKLLQWFSLGLIEIYGNLGIAMGLTFGLLLLLRPVMVRLLRPRFRVTFWMMSWLMGWMWSFYRFWGELRILPVTFRGLVVPARTEEHRVLGYIPELTQTGEKLLTLPGGAQIPFVMTEGLQTVLGVLGFVVVVLIFVWTGRKEKQVKRLSSEGEPMSREWHEAHSIDRNTIVVRIREGLPASFVCRGGAGVNNICLQTELPPGQMELVLRHELIHIRRSHVWFKGLLAAMLIFYWWNPIMWITYRLTCRDLELACDEEVMKDLDEEGRRLYARTLVELASGKPMWGGLTCFGECDAEIRVRRAVNWKREREWESALVWPALIVMFLFLFTSPREDVISREAAWLNHVQGPGLVLDIRHITGDPEMGIQEVWTRDLSKLGDKSLLVQTGDGRWYLISYSWDSTAQRYSWRGYSTQREPEKNQFRQLNPWDKEVVNG